MKPPAAAPAQRRRMLIGAAGGAALLGGAWMGWRRHAAPAGDPAVASLWSQSFATPAGGTLAMAGLRGQPLLVNFWATWCAPCVRELPQIERFHRDFQSKRWQVVGLAIDGPTPVRDFLAKLPLSFPIGLAGLEGTSLVRQLGNDRGGLPFSIVIDGGGALVQRKLGETSYEELAGWARALA